jgi:hypothetical protein
MEMRYEAFLTPPIRPRAPAAGLFDALSSPEPVSTSLENAITLA